MLLIRAVSHCCHALRCHFLERDERVRRPSNLRMNKQQSFHPVLSFWGCIVALPCLRAQSQRRKAAPPRRRPLRHAPARLCRPASPRIAQPRRHPVDRDVDAAPHALVRRLAGRLRAVTAHQFDLQVVQRVEVGQAVLERARERGVRREAPGLAGDQRQHVAGALPLGADRGEDALAGPAV